jgi:hypothetical protein
MNMMFILQYFQTGINWVKVKSYRCTGLDMPTGLQEVQALRIFNKSAYEGGKVVKSYALAAFTPGKIPGTHFCSESESISRPYCGQKGYVNKKSQRPYRESNP